MGVAAGAGVGRWEGCLNTFALVKTALNTEWQYMTEQYNNFLVSSEGFLHNRLMPKAREFPLKSGCAFF